jgi:hypothetical protein
VPKNGPLTSRVEHSVCASAPHPPPPRSYCHAAHGSPLQSRLRPASSWHRLGSPDATASLGSTVIGSRVPSRGGWDIGMRKALSGWVDMLTYPCAGRGCPREAQLPARSSPSLPRNACTMAIHSEAQLGLPPYRYPALPLCNTHHRAHIDDVLHARQRHRTHIAATSSLLGSAVAAYLASRGRVHGKFPRIHTNPDPTRQPLTAAWS